MKFDVNEIEFDLDDSEEYKLTFDEEIALRDTAVSYTHLTLPTIVDV